MRIGIITVYYSENSGSLLQALSLEKKIRELGHDVIFINTKNKYSSHSIKLLLGRIVKESLKLKFNNVRNAIGKYYNFKKDIKRFKSININDIKKHNLDLVIIGSDTVWDIESQYFKESFDVFLPVIDSTPVVSYAASIGNTKLESLKVDNRITQALKNIKKITVRDEYSKSVLSKIIKDKIDIVIDPTILMGKDAFDEFICNVNDNNYILIYSFNDFEKKVVSEIKRFAKNNNLKIISIGKKYDWTDKNVVSSLNSFITYYNYAEYVITNTFHGNVFSILFNKQFINIDYNKKKVDKLLEQYELCDRTYKNNNSNISKIFSNKIDYNKINELLERDRVKSNNILNELLDSGNKKINSSVKEKNDWS